MVGIRSFPIGFRSLFRGELLNFGRVHPGKLTAGTPRMEVWKMICQIQLGDFEVPAANFQAGVCFLNYSWWFQPI